mmetsp:Transcript_96182/g.250557  ORF Transcript_96182/g.250557 Transcript_96182/m.250557 type:complete len:257 (+) Transcript_96182:2060-2830(+)
MESRFRACSSKASSAAAASRPAALCLWNSLVSACFIIPRLCRPRSNTSWWASHLLRPPGRARQSSASSMVTMRGLDSRSRYCSSSSWISCRRAAGKSPRRLAHRLRASSSAKGCTSRRTADHLSMCALTTSSTPGLLSVISRRWGHPSPTSLSRYSKTSRLPSSGSSTPSTTRTSWRETITSSGAGAAESSLQRPAAATSTPFFATPRPPPTDAVGVTAGPATPPVTTSWPRQMLTPGLCLSAARRYCARGSSLQA